MKLYNTLTREDAELVPLNAPDVSIYTCGPTVYDFAHIGHWYTYVRWDTAVRVLKVVGLKPKWVMNITDVGHLVSDADDGEDKLEKGARREGKTAWEIAEYYTKDFIDDMELLSITQPDFLVKATDHIPEQIELIQKLEAKGFTYTIDDGVYYDTSKFEGYADFARLDLDDLQEGARVEVNKQKKNASDFALWKFSPSDRQRDMEWDSPWGKGFPGWHIECSAMAMKYLGETIDIHAGGIDHIPIHHTNEIAQSEAATGKRFAEIWLHSNHVMVNGEKISKSLGNGIRLQEILEKGIPAEAVRLNILESHYRSQSRFSWESLDAAQSRLKAWKATAALMWQPIRTEGEPISVGIADKQQEILDVLADDLNTPKALAAVDAVFSAIAASLLSPPDVDAFHNFLELLDDILGLGLATVPDISDEQKKLLADRRDSRASNDWTKSDELRSALADAGIAVRDTAYGTVWSYL